MGKTTEKAQPPKIVQTAFRLEQDLVSQLKQKASLEYTSVNSLVRRAIKDFLKAHK